MELEEIGINAGNWVDLAQDMDYWRVLVKVIVAVGIFVARKSFTIPGINTETS